MKLSDMRLEELGLLENPPLLVPYPKLCRVWIPLASPNASSLLEMP